MRIKLTPNEITPTINKFVTSKSKKAVNIPRSIVESDYNAAKMNLDSVAEHMTPQEYISARKYLAQIEINDLHRLDI